MQIELISGNVVVAAQQFNPTIFNQLWLLEHGIAEKEDFKPANSFVFTPAFVQFKCSRFALLVLAEQLQFAPAAVDAETRDLILGKVGTIVRLLPETPYIAVGLNFVWHVLVEDMSAFNRALFYRDDHPVFSHFSEADARYGAYLSKNLLGTRLRLDIKPLTVRVGEESQERLQMAFNYNLDLTGDQREERIRAVLENWDDARTKAQEIAKSLEKWRWR